MRKKLKTNRAAAKRFKFTKNNKAAHQKCGKSHLLTNKNGAHKKSPYGRIAPEGVASKIKVLLPHKLR